MFFYQRNKATQTIEEDTLERVHKFVNVLKSSPKLRTYVRTFGITGPCSREQGSYINRDVHSDIDFFAVVNTFNPIKEYHLRKQFNKTFNSRNVSLFTFAPSIFIKPDLMFYEASHSPHTYFGSPLPPLNIDKISRFEGYRNLVYRGAYFLAQHHIHNHQLIIKKKDKLSFLYTYAKVVFAFGEIILLLERKYVADNFKRNLLVKTSRLAPLFLKKEHQNMHDFRYHNKIPKINYEKYTKQGLAFIHQAYQLLLKHTFITEDRLKKAHPSIISSITNKTIFTTRMMKLRQPRIHLITEPFIALLIKLYTFLQHTEQHTATQQELTELLNYWKNAGWFYYKI